jgi:transcriptional regulator with XRE-family HTH domain
MVLKESKARGGVLVNDEIDIHKLAALVRTKRGKRGLRETAQEIGDISISTLSRVELGKIPDLGTFLRLCRWLGVPAEQFAPEVVPSDTQEPAPTVSTQEIVVAHLRADRTLDSHTAEALSTMIRLAYEAASQGKLELRQQE